MDFGSNDTYHSPWFFSCISMYCGIGFASIAVVGGNFVGRSVDEVAWCPADSQPPFAGLQALALLQTRPIGGLRRRAERLRGNQTPAPGTNGDLLYEVTNMLPERRNNNQKHHDLTIAIPAYNAEQYVDCAVATAIDCRPAEILVGDDGSTDDTYARFCAWRERLGDALRMLHNDINCGVTQNYQRMLGEVRTEFCLKLDVDDVIRSRYVDAALQAMRQDQEIVIAAGIGAEFPADSLLEEDERRGFVDSVLETDERWVLSGIEAAAFVARWLPPASGGSTVYRMAAWRAVGGFDPNIGWASDHEILFRLAKVGKIAFWTAPVLAYRRGILSSVTEIAMQQKKTTDDLIRTYISGLDNWQATPVEPMIRKRLRRLLLSKLKVLTIAMTRSKRQVSPNRSEAARHVSELFRFGMRTFQ